MLIITGLNLAPIWENHRQSKKNYLTAQSEKNIELANTFFQGAVSTHKLLVKQLNFKTVMKMMEGWNPVSLLNKQKGDLIKSEKPKQNKGKGKRKAFSAMDQVMKAAGALYRAEQFHKFNKN